MHIKRNIHINTIEDNDSLCGFKFVRDPFEIETKKLPIIKSRMVLHMHGRFVTIGELQDRFRNNDKIITKEIVNVLPKFVFRDEEKFIKDDYCDTCRYNFGKMGGFIVTKEEYKILVDMKFGNAYSEVLKERL